MGYGFATQNTANVREAHARGSAAAVRHHVHEAVPMKAAAAAAKDDRVRAEPINPPAAAGSAHADLLEARARAQSIRSSQQNGSPNLAVPKKSDNDSLLSVDSLTAVSGPAATNQRNQVTPALAVPVVSDPGRAKRLADLPTVPTHRVS